MAATLLPWELAANVLFARGVLSRQLSAGEITAAKRALDFWRSYDLGRRRYQAAVATKELVLASGDWALFSPHNLFALLAGIRIPLAFRRSEYATNLIQQNEKLELDIHSMPELLPLFCHPLGQPTSPLEPGPQSARYPVEVSSIEAKSSRNPVVVRFVRFRFRRFLSCVQQLSCQATLALCHIAHPHGAAQIQNAEVPGSNAGRLRLAEFRSTPNHARAQAPGMKVSLFLQHLLVALPHLSLPCAAIQPVRRPATLGEMRLITTDVPAAGPA